MYEIFFLSAKVLIGLFCSDKFNMNFNTSCANWADQCLFDLYSMIYLEIKKNCKAKRIL